MLHWSYRLRSSYYSARAETHHLCCSSKSVGYSPRYAWDCWSTQHWHSVAFSAGSDWLAGMSWLRSSFELFATMFGFLCWGSRCWQSTGWICDAHWLLFYRRSWSYVWAPHRQPCRWDGSCSSFDGGRPAKTHFGLNWSWQAELVQSSGRWFLGSAESRRHWSLSRVTCWPLGSSKRQLRRLLSFWPLSWLTAGYIMAARLGCSH